jgi:medium-chain acyl-[acyl-carrier-protein] hydrolase
VTLVTVPYEKGNHVLKIKHTHTINYFEADRTYKVKLPVLFQQLQNAAVLHSEKAGYRMDSLIQNGQGWVLNKMDMEIFRYPEYKEQIEIITWSRSLKGVKAKREFLIYSNTEKLVSASSVWVFVDSIRMKIIKIPDSMEDRYTIHPDVALNENIERWRAEKDSIADLQERITTRISDYDPMGHINNTIYIDFLETAINRKIGKPSRISAIRIQYITELNPTTTWVKIGFQKSDAGYRFAISDDQNLNAAGEMVLDDS